MNSGKSFIRIVGEALVSSVENKQKQILDDLKLAQDKKAQGGGPAPITDGGTPGAPPAPGGGPSESGKGLGSIDQGDAIKLQMGTAELSTISAAATGVINAEKTAITTIARNI